MAEPSLEQPIIALKRSVPLKGDFKAVRCCRYLEKRFQMGQWVYDKI
jgi:hypothetical protein